MKFLQLAETILKEEKRLLTNNEIWDLAVQKGYDKKLNSQGKTPSKTMAAQLYLSIRDDLNSPFGKTGRPARFYLKSQENEIDLSNSEFLEKQKLPKTKSVDLLEKDLHPYLTYYALSYLYCYTKTINHSKSSKREFGEWVHPDIVGCCFPHKDWNREVYDLSSSIGNISIRLLSFELKRELNFGNLRESFFQTVSNSSWANQSYLVAAEVSEDEDFRSELSRLSTSFGVGVIKLDLEDPHSSETIFAARYRETLDWETIDKLTMNPDFKSFISRVKIDITTNTIHTKEYNQFLDLETLKAKTNAVL